MLKFSILSWLSAQDAKPLAASSIASAMRFDIPDFRVLV